MLLSKRFLARALIATTFFVLPACTPAGSPAPTALPTPEPATPTAAATAAPAATATAAVYNDPFAYCAAAGTIDAPDARYKGEKVPETVARGLIKASGAAADAPLEMFTAGSLWRCADGKVLGCFVGANLPCDSKANTDKTPSDAEKEFCQANPSADFIPAVATGHDTIYEWKCKDGAPQAGKQVFNVDAQGFIQEIWYTIPQP